MSGLDHLRGRAAECEALWRILGGQARRTIGQRLAVWQAAIAAVEADYTPAAPEDAEDQEDLDPAPSEEDLAVAAEAVALFQGAVETFRPRDQPPAPDDLVGPDVYAPEDAAALAAEAAVVMAPVPDAPPTSGTRTVREGPTWNKARLDLAENMWRFGRSAAEIFAAVNGVTGKQPVKTKQDVFNKAHVMGWKRDVAVGKTPAAPVPEPVPAPATPADDDDASPEEIKAAIRGGKRAKAIAWEFGIELGEAQALCAEVDAEAKAA